MSEWISVEDRLPDFYEYVLLYANLEWEFGPSVIVGYRDECKHIDYSCPYGNGYIPRHFKENTTHWMPLPKPPEEK